MKLRLNSIHHLVSATVFQSLVTALVLSRLDYGNRTLIGLPIHLIGRLQSVQNAAARLISSPPIRPHHGRAHQLTLVSLRVPERIVFKVVVQTYRALHGDAPQYMRPVLAVILDRLILDHDLRSLWVIFDL